MEKGKGHCCLRLALACLFVLGIGGSLAQADPILNGGFEDPIPFNYWGTNGDTQIQGASMGVTPIEGLHQALLATATDGSINPIVVPGSGVSERQLESGLGLANGSLSSFSGSTVLAGSGISQTVHLNAGDRVSFAWDFLTNQTYNDGTNDSIPPSATNNDFSFFDFVKLGPTGSSQIVKLADTFYGYQNNPSAPGGFTTGLVLTSITNPFISETTYQTYSWTVQSSGDYSLGVGVVHVTAGGQPDNGVNSGLVVDNFQVQAVPEPSSFVGFGLLAVGMFCLRRRR